MDGNDWIRYSSEHMLQQVKSFQVSSNEKPNIFLRAQGRAAMLGFILLSASYLANGQIIPGIY